MVSLSTWVRYAAKKFQYSVGLSIKKYNVGQINAKEFSDALWKNFFQGKITFLHWNKGEEMEPTIAGKGGTVLVRKVPYPAPTNQLAYTKKFEIIIKDQVHLSFLVLHVYTLVILKALQREYESTLFQTRRHVFVGDVVMLQDPEKQDDFLVRRLAAIEGYEMVSKDEKDEPFILEKDQCWVVSDNESMKPNEARDSRLFGPVPMSNIVGRVIYSLRSAVDHGPVQNSYLATDQDSPVLAVELDVEEMARSRKL